MHCGYSLCEAAFYLGFCLFLDVDLWIFIYFFIFFFTDFLRFSLLLIAPFARLLSRVWRVVCCAALHLRDVVLVIGVVYLTFPPIPRPLSRFWRVVCCAALQT